MYGEGALDEVTVPQTDVERSVRTTTRTTRRTYRSRPGRCCATAARPGGQGAVTTTGGTAGRPASRRVARQPERHRGKVAPTTTGDATTGGLSTPAGGSTSDQSTEPEQVTDFTDART